MSESLHERLARAQERVERPAAEAWRPDDPRSGHPVAIAGELVEISWKAGAGYEGRGATLATVRTEEREWGVWCFGKILEEELAPAPLGSIVAIRYEGRRQGVKKEYTSWRVVVDRAGAQPAAAASAIAAPDPPVDAKRDDPPEPLEHEPAAASPEGVCEVCGGERGRHATGCPSRPVGEACDACGFLNGHHRSGCPNEIPF